MPLFGKKESRQEEETESSDMLLASNLVQHPEKIDAFTNRYLLLLDRTMTGQAFNSMPKAINLLATRGYRPISITTGSQAGAVTALLLYCLLEKAT
jgi:hypothetical protein